MKRIYPLIVCMIFFYIPNYLYSKNNPVDTVNLDHFIREKMEKHGIPGLAVVLFDKGTVVYRKEFGYSDIKHKVAISDESIFELGSNSKAFTALGILYLERLGLLKLQDPVVNYLPWFYCNYKGTVVKNLTIQNCLSHTSGIPFNSIGLIKPGNDQDELEHTIRRLQGIELSSLPGNSFEYATINYDILGLVIEKITGQSFENYLTEKIIRPLELNNTIVGKVPSHSKDAVGYKREFLSVKEFDAPVFKGNTPAGYVRSTIKDLEKWLGRNINLQDGNVYDSLIAKSRIPYESVRELDNATFYSNGWYIREGINNLISHGGNNPNFSSYISFDPKLKNGVGILCNINSDFPERMGAYLLALTDDRQNVKPTFHLQDQNQYIDVFSSILIIVSSLFILFSVYNLIRKAVTVFRSRQPVQINDYLKSKWEIISCIFLVSFIGYSLYNIPSNLFDDLPWSFVELWGPFNFLLSIQLVFASFVIFFVYYVWSLPLNKKFSDQLYNLVILSILSGLGNALIIFSINQSVKSINTEISHYLIYFLLGILLYLMTQLILRKALIKVSNNMVFEKRNEIADLVITSSYEKMEAISKEEVITVLNNDTLSISRLPNILVGFISSFVTILFCLIYMASLNAYAFLGALIVLVTATTLYAYAGKFSQQYFKKNRVTQGVYAKFIYGLLNGLKELKINGRKALDFFNELKSNSDEFRKTNTLANIKFANTVVLGELLFTLVIGSVVFIIPICLSEITIEDIRNFVFVFLYITGPVNGLLNLFPELLQIRVSLNRIDEFKNRISSMSELPKSASAVKQDPKDFELLELKEVCYEYASANLVENFAIGPVDHQFRNGEITFIVGGNGSGKTTLAKILVGLYSPTKGEIYVNDNKVDKAQLSELYSIIFSDYYMFDKFYGVDYQKKTTEIDEKLTMLKLKNKILIENGYFNPTSLSTGQKKRLALLISYIEDKSICLFDEWAADQDPEFRRFFYEELLIELKKSNKCVIVITHDDRYFHLADKIIKMDRGKMATEEIEQKFSQQYV